MVAKTLCLKKIVEEAGEFCFAIKDKTKMKQYTKQPILHIMF